MKIIVKTTTGSIYRLNPAMKMYEMLLPDGDKLTRKSVGFYEDLKWETREDGLRLALTCEAKSPNTNRTRIVSSPVHKIESA